MFFIEMSAGNFHLLWTFFFFNARTKLSRLEQSTEWAFQVALVVKNLLANVGDVRTPFGTWFGKIH